MKIICAHCGKACDKPPNEVNRAREAGYRLFCDRRCAGLGRRAPFKSKAQKRAEKAAYDSLYRIRNHELLKAKKRAHHLRTYDPAKARVERKKKMARHVEYCRRPEYKRWKSVYDRKYRSKKFFGPFAEAAMILADLKHSITERASNHEIRQENQTINKVQRRRRDAQEKERSRPRGRDRRRDHSAIVRP